MKGYNEITLNGATMILIVQHYFRTVLFTPGNVPEVVSVSGRDDGFTVKIATKEGDQES